MLIKKNKGEKEGSKKKFYTKLVLKEYTSFTKTQIAILAYFARFDNHPSTYMEIARAYVSSSYSNYQKACEALVAGGYLERLKTGKFKVKKSRWENVKKGVIQIERRLPYFDNFFKNVGSRSKRSRQTSRSKCLNLISLIK